jgi:hypothetical protein
MKEPHTEKKATDPGEAQTTGGPPCDEAQADGVPCEELGRDCEDCDQAEPERRESWARQD